MWVEREIKVDNINDTLLFEDPANINEKTFKEEDGIKRALLVFEKKKGIMIQILCKN